MKNQYYTSYKFSLKINKVVRLILAVSFYIVSFLHFANAQIVPVKSNFKKLSELPLNTTPASEIVTASDNNAIGEQPPSTISNRVSLGICDNANLCVFNGVVTVSVTVNIEYKTMNEPTVLKSINNVVLTISYNPQTGQSYIEKSSYLIYDAFEIKVIPVSYSTSDNNILESVCLFNDMDFERKWDIEGLSFYNLYPDLEVTYNATDNTFEVEWDYYDWANEYDLEWVWVDDYNTPDNLTTPFIPASQVQYDFFNNAERVTLNTNCYKVANVFEHGYLIFRVRAVGYDQGLSPRHRIPAAWSLASSSGTINNLSTPYQNDFIFIDALKTHHPVLNWMYEVSYSENGKKKEAVEYFDGTLRSRQTVSMNYTENTAIVQENFYDHAGRASISVLPAPTFTSTLGYYSGFNKNINNQSFTQEDFDRDPFISSCNTPANPIVFSSSSGASKYFSANNPNANQSYHQYIPDAQLYPYVQVEYMPDNTGRVKRHSGVGYTHALAEGKATRFEYSTPEQKELDRLFGTNVGVSTHYKKNVVYDANGQASISFTNASGTVIATALAGAAPSGLQALNSNTTIPFEVNLLQPFAAPASMEKELSIIRDIQVEKDNSTYKFKYEITGKELFDACPQNFCFDCVYDLEISLLDECNEEKLPAGKITRTVGKITPQNLGDPEYNTTCNSIESYKFSTDAVLSSYIDNDGFLVVNNLKTGSYRLIKTLRVNNDALEYYTEQYIQSAQQNGCLPTEQQLINEAVQSVDLSNCDMDCETCKEKLGTAQEFENAYKTEVGASELTQAEKDYINNLYQQRIAHCDIYCNEHVDKCRSYYNTLLAQVSPGGQYAKVASVDPETKELTLNPSPFNILATGHPTRASSFADYHGWLASNYNIDTVNVFINGQWKQLKDISPSELYFNWKSEWATIFVKIHPEYCQYLRCVQESESNAYDEEMLKCSTYDEAYNKGFLNPLRFNGVNTLLPESLYTPATPTYQEDPFLLSAGLTQRNDFKTAMQSALMNVNNTNLSAWHYALIGSCRQDWSNPTAFTNCIRSLFGTNNILGCVTSAQKDEAWKVFRGIYLSEKRKRELIYNHTTACSTSAAQIAILKSHYSQLNIVFPSLNQFAQTFGFTDEAEMKTPSIPDKNRGKAQQNMGDACTKQCNGYKNYWSELLKPCIGQGDITNGNDLNNMLDELVQVCLGSCDGSNPFGASELSPNNYSNTGTYPHKNFAEVFQSHNLNLSALCSPDLIGLPFKRNHDYFLNNSNGSLTNVNLNDTVPGTLIMVQALDNCVCSRIAKHEEDFNTYSTSNNNLCGALHEYINKIEGTNYTVADINLLKKACVFKPSGGGSMHDCNDVEYPLPVNQGGQIHIGNTSTPIPNVPASWLCNTPTTPWGDKTCLNCFDIATAALSFKEKYGVFPLEGHDYPFLFANIVNSGKSFNLTYPEFVDFILSCNEFYKSFFDVDITQQNTPNQIPQFVDGFQQMIPMNFTPANDNVITDPNQAGTCACNRIFAIYARWIEAKNNNELLPAHENFEDFALLYGLDIRSDAKGGTFDLDDLLNHCDLLKDVSTFVNKQFINDQWVYELNYCEVLKLLKGASKACRLNIDCDNIKEVVNDLPTPLTIPAIKTALNTTYGAGINFHVIEEDVPVMPCENPANCPTEKLFVVCSDLTEQMLDFKDLFIDLANVKDFGNPAALNRLVEDNHDLNYNIAYTKSVFNPSSNLDPITCTNNGHNTTGNPLWEYEETVTFSNVDYFKFHIGQNSTSCGWYIKHVTGLSTTAHVRTIRGIKNIVPLNVFTNGQQHFSCDIEVALSGGGTTLISTTGFTTCFPVSNCCSADRTICNAPMFPQIAAQSPCEQSLIKAATMNARQKYQQIIQEARTNFQHNYRQRCLATAPLEVFEMKYELYQYHYTLYYYDVAGNLVRTVSPKGVNVITNNTDLDNVGAYRASNSNTQQLPNHKFESDYQYNSYNQLVWQKTPDAGITTYFYDYVGRLIFSQNAEQLHRSTATAQHHSYTMYDGLGRIAEVGELIYNVSPLLVEPIFINHIHSKIPASVQIILNNSNKRDITRTYYDDVAPVTGSLNFTQQHLRGRVAHITYSKLQVGSYNTAVHYSYDIHGNVNSMIREIKSLELQLAQSKKQIDYTYDLVSGNVNQVSYQAGEPDEFYHRYEYDADNRLIRAYTSTDAIHWDRDARYEYYKHGPLARTELGQHKVQGIDYAYTLHGWLKGVNSNTLTPERDMGKDGFIPSSGSNSHSTVARDVFGFTLNYYQSAGGKQDYLAINHANINGTKHFEANTTGSAFYTSTGNLYNGNIKSMVVAIGKFMENNSRPLGYAYQYDQLNRLVAANTWNNINQSTNEWDNAGNAIPDYQNVFTYDANGNILTQLRKGSTASGLDMDNLTYNYTTGTDLNNRLLYVDEHSSINNSAHADDVDDQSAGNYDYDKIGNLIKDEQEEIANIEWTVYGKIKRITRTPLSAKPDLEFEYSPDGLRICKIVKPKNGLRLWKYTYYVHDAQGNVLATYNRELEAIFDPEKVDFAQTNAALVAIEGGSNFNTFIQGLHPLPTSGQWLLDLKSAIFNAGLESQFVQHFDPTFILTSDPALFALVFQQFNPSDLLDYMANTYGLNTLYSQGCASVGASFIEQSVNYAPHHFLLHLSVYNNTLLEQMYLSAGGSLTLPMPDANTMALHILSSWTNTQIAQWIHANLSCNDYGNFMMGMYSPTHLKSILLGGPYLITIYTAHYTNQQLIDAFLSISSIYTWQLMLQNSVPGHLLDLLYFNDMAAFYSHVNTTYWQFIAPLQENQLPYTRTAYYNFIQTHFSAATYQQLVDMFIHLSNQYRDKFVVNEWHIYGSSRIGTQKINRQLVQVVFNGTWNSYEGNFSEEANHVVTFYEPDVERTTLARGNKRYELVNHVGNVLVVISDKKLPHCTEGTTDYYTAEVLQATDYSAFHATLKDRVWYANTADKYRYGGSNGQEKDDDIFEGAFTAQYWEYDSRLGRRWNVDPVTYPWQSTYSVFNNNSIAFIDPDGLFGRRKDARKYKKEHNIDGKIKKNKDGTFSIETKNKKYTAGDDKDFNLEVYRNDHVIEEAYVEAERKNQGSVGREGVRGGKVNSFEFNYALGGGYGIELGIVKDSKGNKSWFFSHGPVIGLTLSVGFSEKAIRPTDGKDFQLKDYPGFASGYSLGLLIIGAEWAGNRQKSVFRKKDLYDRGDNYNQVGFGVFYGLNVGASWSRTNTKFIFK